MFNHLKVRNTKITFFKINSPNLNYLCKMKNTTPVQNLPIESHPLEPFLPRNAKILMLGSFPPPKARWSMEWFYPNWINDMWRIMGHIFFNDKNHFEIKGEKRFDKEKIIRFCTEKGIALYDTATQVRRLKENASDKFLEVVTPTDIPSLLEQIPHCKAIITTGQKATDVIIQTFGCPEPPVGSFSEFTVQQSDLFQQERNSLNSQPPRTLRLWRMPSSSRAYPLPLPQKGEFYRRMINYEKINLSL